MDITARGYITLLEIIALDTTLLPMRSLDFFIQHDTPENNQHPWSTHSWSSLEDHAQKYIIYHTQNSFALFHLSILENLAHLLKIITFPPHRRKGHGKELLMQCFQHLTENNNINRCFLEVETTNLPAMALYQQLHFDKIALAKNFYGPGQDCYRMNRPLK